MLLRVCCAFVFKGCFPSLPFPLEKIQDHSLTQALVEGESRGLETPWGLSCWGKGAGLQRVVGGRGMREAQGWAVGSSSHPTFLFSLMWDLWSKQTSPSLRWGETPTPSALKPQPICAVAQAWELPGLWLGINIPCPSRANVSPVPGPPAPPSRGEALMCVWGHREGVAHGTAPS